MTRFHGLLTTMRRASAGAALVLLSTGAAFAQNPLPGLTPPAAAPQAPAGGAAPSADMPWQKLCDAVPQTGQQSCSVRADIRDDNGAVIVRVALQKSVTEDRYGILVFAPLGVMLQPGVVVTIDGQRAITLGYEQCAANPAICIAQADATQALIDQMKRGGQMTLTISAPQRPSIPLPVSLRGFTRAFDSPGATVAPTQPGAPRTP